MPYSRKEMTSRKIGRLAGRELATQTSYAELAVAGSALSQRRKAKRRPKRKAHRG
jgi:hypothetical protein